ncbi:hypothetical protein H072_2011 [Dactylellina haptotyla CBS 200.50]|uniref:Uncharacterized protein n=1 Tax=Dactylellina haptotyla (strain CBS 200.50) TaxID=1284197 RepID=S8BWY5_DACHA|nr:hypothetical protein H072_2011 [Dactylellina haptotyla CBS 200.50]
MARPLLSNTPTAVNPYNVSSLTFDVGPLTDFSNDWALRQKEWPNFLPNITSSPPKKFAFYKEISVDSNPYLCFQNVIIQKAPSQSALSGSAESAENAGTRSGSRYGRDFFSLGIPIRVMVEMVHQLTKVHSIPLGSCRSTLKGDHFWIIARPPPAYPPQLVDEDMESFFLQWDEFVKTDLRSSSWMCHVIGQARVKSESNQDFERDGKDEEGSLKGKSSGLSSRRRKGPPSPLSHGDFSLGITVQKIVLLEKVLVEAPTVREMEEQKHTCFLKGHEEPAPKSPTGTSSSQDSFVSRFSHATKSRYELLTSISHAVINH